MNKFILLLLMIVAVSGCIGGGEKREVKVVATEGIQINKFNVDPPFAAETDTVKFDIDIENVGGATATNVVAVLSGTGKTWREGAVELSVDKNVFGAAIASMDPPKPSENLPGAFKATVIVLQPPDLPEGVQTEFPLTLRVDYGYTTSGSIVIPTTSKSLYVEKTRAGQAVDSNVRADNNNAPLKAGLGTGRIPLVLEESGSTTETYIIEIQNVGSGMPISGTQVGKVKAVIKALTTGLTTFTCTGDTTNSHSDNTETVEASADIAKLRTTGKLEIPCVVAISTATVGSTGSLTFTVDTQYNYFVTQTKNVKIEGRRGTVAPVAATSIPTATATPTVTPTATATPTVTPTATATPTVTPTATATPTPTSTATPTATPTPADTTAPSVGGITPVTAVNDVSAIFTAFGIQDAESGVTLCKLKADGIEQAGDMALSATPCKTTACTATKPHTFTTVGTHTLQAKCTNGANIEASGTLTEITVSAA